MKAEGSGGGRVVYRRRDGYYRRAKEEGYRSRAAYKLIELSRRHGLIRTGNHVVDLGAWPGGWLQVAAELVGPRGRVVGVDLEAIEPITNPVVAVLRGDVGDPAVQEAIAHLSGGRVDVVLSDMAPKLTGVRVRDTARSAELADVGWQVASRLLRPQGRFLMKTFSSPEADAMVHVLRAWFARVKCTRPDSSRSGSAEIYIVGVGFQRRPSESGPEPD